MVTFDAIVLADATGREVPRGRIIYGPSFACTNVVVSSQRQIVLKRIDEILSILGMANLPDLYLNRHCPECEFIIECRRVQASEMDDLSLLPGMGASERLKLRKKGIFTTTQLSYTFRPRRRKRMGQSRKEKYSHALKALALREGKIHVSGCPQYEPEGTLIFLDVEAAPFSDYNYLIGLRISSSTSCTQFSLWADSKEDERLIWIDFLNLLEGVDFPQIVHYGSFEKHFFKKMQTRYGKPAQLSEVLASSVNLLSTIYGAIYFPTLSNSLKDIAGYLGFYWKEHNLAGLQSIILRHEWEQTGHSDLKEKRVNLQCR